MVDLRPLLFINTLMLMLFLTAGFVQINTPEHTVGTSIPEPLVPDSSSQKDNSERQTEQATSTEEVKGTPTLEKSPEQRLLTKQEADEAVFEGDAIFADEILPPHKDQQTLDAIKHLGITDDSDNPMVIAYESELKKPAPLKPEPLKEKPVIKTGTLIVRSNVHDDTVLVNGKPYGPTKLELDLTPGSYIVEVAKKGYKSWESTIDVRRGKTQTLNARLEHYTSVDYINGEWINAVTTGEGSYREDGNLEYNGSFVDGQFHGMGSVRYANGLKYSGEWFEGKMKGEGSLTTVEGDTYIGEFDDNKFNGEGTLTKVTGDIYTGFWIDGELNGQGSLTTKDGLLYVGGFSDNLFHGSGSLTYPDGGHYEGSFSNGLYHGKGTEVYPNGKKYVGQFIDGLYHGKGEMLNPNGSKITGTFKDGKPFGKATLTTAEGEIFTARSSEPGVCYRPKSYRATECPELEGW